MTLVDDIVKTVRAMKLETPDESELHLAKDVIQQLEKDTRSVGENPFVDYVRDEVLSKLARVTFRRGPAGEFVRTTLGDPLGGRGR